MKTPHQRRVEEFMRRAGQDLPAYPALPTKEVALLRAKLILEEALETITALGVDVDVHYQETPHGLPIDIKHCQFKVNEYRIASLSEIADGCADISVVTIGTLSACGIDDKGLLEEVDRSNLRKFGPGGYKRADGKWIKPASWQPPNIAGVLREQQLVKGK